MATITKRSYKKGLSYSVQIRMRHDGGVYSESRSFPKKSLAQEWALGREAELRKPGVLDKIHTAGTTIGTAIDLYVEAFDDGTWGRSKRADLIRIRAYDICKKSCDKVNSSDFVKHIMWRLEDCGPSTAKNDLIWLRVVLKTVRPAFNIDANLSALDDAQALCEAKGLVSRSGKRSRRPTLEELNQLMEWFSYRPARKNAVPYAVVIPFLLFSGRRVAEMCRLRWEDLDHEKRRVLVRDMKHPRKTKGNHVWVQLPDEAWAIIQEQPKVDERIFPYGPDTISSVFPRACKTLGIVDLHLHDLRHECASWLGEKGLAVPFIAQVTAHRDWNMLQRYTHVDVQGDKYENWSFNPLFLN